MNLIILTLSRKSLGNVMATLIHLAVEEDNVPHTLSRITEL